ncbi:porin [Noviherbaspirillum galbum]|uniref:Porin n=1 Tax=Noviherbaspirillum galbum TaxID=2709383 RepID=A0A6B3SX00_9BURK|nr:porin [Noviherbaspirillum galbum]NEX62972.1 porin [Noviherbaspirillum galbum]
MKTKKALAAGAALAAMSLMGIANAQTSVNVYGIMDAAVEYYTNSNATGDSLWRMPSLGGGMFPSRIGFKGSEDLGGGMSAIFTLENGFTPDTGSLGQGGRLFGRQAWVGLSSPYGQLTLGRNYNMIYLSSFDVDIFGPSQYGLGSLDAAIPNGRSDNSIAYKGTFNGFTVGATYSLGRDTSAAGGPAGTNCPGESATNSRECREWSTMLRYDAPSWGAVAAYGRLNGGPNASGGINSADRSDSRLHVAGYAKFASWKVGGGVVARNNEGSATTPRSNLYYVGAAYRLTPQVTIDGQLAKLDYRDSPNDSTQLLLRGIYDFSKRTSGYVAVGRINNGGTAAVALSAGGSVGAGLSQTGLITGIKHAF